MLARIAPKFKGPISDETPLTDDGLDLDSLALADLLGAIEHEFSIHVREDEIVPETFATVGRLWRFLESRADARADRPRAADEISLLKVLQRGGDRAPFIMVNGDVYGGGALYCFTLTRLLGEHQTAFEEQWQRLTLTQRAVLRALVLEDGRELLSADVRARHRLPVASSVQSALAALLKQDIVMKEGARYVAGDSLYREWVARKTF